jgi:hypothetical protein
MGTTCANFHLVWRGSVADAAKAVSRAYGKLGYERAKKPVAEGGKHVVLLARAGERYVSVYDSTNADLDSGELKDAALAASKLLKTGAVFTSLYDSDSYEFVVFNNGRQVDFLMSDGESYDGPLKRVTPRSRATLWARIFATMPAADQLAQAATAGTVFADGSVAALSGLIGLAGDRPLRHYGDFKDEPDLVAASLHFAKTATPQPVPEPDQIVLRNYFDRHNSRKLLVYPAAWPMPREREEVLTWLMLSEGAGFSGGSATVEIFGPAGLTFSRGIINGAKFHNGQIVGGYELPSNASREEAEAYLESKRFALTPLGAASPDERRYGVEYPNLYVPPLTPQRTTQILVILQLHLTASETGEWEIKVTLRPGAGAGCVHRLPTVRVAAVEQDWLPVVSGLNPKTGYDTADVVEDRLPEHLMDVLVRRSADRRLAGLPPAEARAALQNQLSEGRERQYRLWLHDLEYARRRFPVERELDQPAIASNVAILRDDGQATLDVCRIYLEGWLRPLTAKGWEVRLRAERQMTESLHVGKIKKEGPTAAVLADKAWGRLFDDANAYQAITVEFVPPGGEFPIAGMGLHRSLRSRSAAVSADAEWSEYNAQLTALTLGKMRGRRFDRLIHGHTLHAFNWVINHADRLGYMDTSIDDMKLRLDRLAAGSSPLQAWHGQATWIPVFDRADDYESTIYEEMSALNFFRGILHEQQQGLKDRRMTAAWCGNVLRMVTPHMWLCGDLVAQLDRAALDRVAIVSEVDGNTRINRRPGCAMDDFELALLPILPVETSRTIGRDLRDHDRDRPPTD